MASWSHPFWAPYAGKRPRRWISIAPSHSMALNSFLAASNLAPSTLRNLKAMGGGGASIYDVMFHLIDCCRKGLASIEHI